MARNTTPPSNAPQMKSSFSMTSPGLLYRGVPLTFAGPYLYRDLKHCCKPIHVIMSATDNATMQRRSKALTFRRIAKQRARALGRFPGVAKVKDRLAFRPKDLAML